MCWQVCVRPMCTDRARLFRHVRFSVRFLPGEQRGIEIMLAKCQNQARRLCGHTMKQSCQLELSKHTHTRYGGERHICVFCIIMCVCICVKYFIFYILAPLLRKKWLNMSEFVILCSQNGIVSRLELIDILSVFLTVSVRPYRKKYFNTSQTSLDSAGESGAISWLCIARL